jgi:16S rRNA (adenine1518-N6/adenine1519-N6)-dimethyltransferase
MPKAKLGQNFLVDLNLLEIILTNAELSEKDSVLEVGTGTGSLTARLANLAGAVTSVELDLDFHRLAKESLNWRENVQLIYADILAGKNELRSEVVRRWEEFSIERKCERKKLIANLPYAVATPVIANLLISDIEIERMVVMVQWEMAERLVAVPGTKDYSSLAVLTQSLADVKVIRKLGPGVFWPPPAVDSAIVLIQPNPEKRQRIDSPLKFREFLRNLYTHRRKNLRQAIVGWPTGKLDKHKVDELIASLGMDGSQRAEMLSLNDHYRLYSQFCQVF